MKNKLLGFLLMACLALPAAAEEASSQAAIRLLKGALKPSSASYKGRLNVTYWTRKGATSEDARVWYRPPNVYRWEFLKPDGRIDRVLITDGAEERLELGDDEPQLKGRAAHGQPKQLAPEQEWDLLMSNYELSRIGSELVAGRPAWVLELAPHEDGKPFQRLWVDAQSGIILAVKKYQPGERRAVFSRFVQFQLDPQDLDEVFQFLSGEDTGESIEHGYDLDFLSPEAYQAKTGHSVAVPKALPMGFKLESVDVFQADGHSVVHYRYTDGLSALSLFQSNRPARFSNPKSVSAHPEDWKGPALFHINRGGHILQEHSGNKYWTLISDLSPASMQTLLGALK